MIQNVMLKYFFLQVFERIQRFKELLRHAKMTAAPSTQRVVRAFSTRVDDIEEQLLGRMNFWDLGPTLSVPEVYVMSAHLDFWFRELRRLHDNLVFLWAKQPSPQTEAFVRSFMPRLVNCLPDPKLPILSVVVSNRYMFEQVELAGYFDTREPQDDRATPTLFLPHIEADHPLQWAPLVHEIGHVASRPLRSWLSDDLANDPAVKSEMHRNWLNEIYADIVGVKLLGAAYVVGFLDFITVPGLDASTREATHLHPFADLRIQVMRDVMEADGIPPLPIGESPVLNAVCKDLVSFAVALFEERCEHQMHMHGPSTSRDGLDVRDLAQRIVPQLPGLVNIPKPQGSIRWQHLVDRLRRGIPIGTASPDKAVQEASSNALLAVRTRLRTNDSTESTEALRDELDVLYAGVAETHVSTEEMIAAGWIYKINHLYGPPLNDIRLLANANWREEWKHSLLRLDGLLRSSIETAYLANTLQSGAHQ